MRSCLGIQSTILLLIGRITWVAAYDLPYNATFPDSITLRAAVMTKTVPLAYYAEDTNTNNTADLNFPQYRGFQPDLLRELQRIAKQKDNITLRFELEQAPPFTYTQQFEYLANDCNQSTNAYQLSIDDCHRYDLIVGDYYGYPSRSIRTLLTPPFLTTAASALRYTGRQTRIISTLQEAQALKEPVCLLRESFYDDRTLERFPGINATWCFNHTQCVQLLKNDSCALFVEDELQLRYIMVQDAELEVTHERFVEQYIVWPLNARLDPVLQQLLIRWIYEAKTIGVLDELYDHYFRVNYCPIGKAGRDCQAPCSPTRGLADRSGTCVCESTRWTGDDCSTEVLEDKHLIPLPVSIVCYLMVGVNFTMVAVCAIWMLIYRNTAQVKVAQPLFLGLVLIGCLTSTSTIFAMLAEDEGQGPVPACMAIPWLYSVGFSITFGTLFAKIRRVFLIFKAAANMQRLKISVRETFFTIGAILAVDVAILTTWTIEDPLHWVRTVMVEDQFGYPLSTIGYCTSTHWLAFVAAIAMLHFTLLLLATYLCYASRHIPTEFSESKYVSLAMISNLQIFVIGLPVLAMLKSESETSVFVRSAMVWINDFVVVSFIFGNLMYLVHWHPSRPHHTGSEFLRAAMNSYIENQNNNNRGSNRRSENAVVPDRTNSATSEGEGVLGPGTGRLFSTFAPNTMMESNADQTVQRDDAAGAIPAVLMTVSETEPRLHVDDGNGQRATVPFTQINFDVSGEFRMPDDYIISCL